MFLARSCLETIHSLLSINKYIRLKESGRGYFFFSSALSSPGAPEVRWRSLINYKSKRSSKLQDIEVITKYQGWISWSDETKNRDIEIKGIGVKTVMMTDVAFYIPVHWAEFDKTRYLCEVWSTASLLKLRPVFIIWGNPDRENTEKIWWQTMKITGFVNDEDLPLHVVFVDAKAKIQSGRLYAQHLDGLDWNETLKRIAYEGKNAKPVWKWDK